MRPLTPCLRRWPAAAGLLLSLAVTACQTAPAQNDSLYQQLGGRDGISKLNTTLLLNIAKDRRIAPIFKDTDINLLHKLLNQQFCMLAGGPCVYTGRSMYETHRDLHLTGADFNDLVEDLIDAMESQDIPIGAQNRLLAKLAPMRREIVGTQPPPPVDRSAQTVGGPTPPGYSNRRQN